MRLTAEGLGAFQGRGPRRTTRKRECRWPLSGSVITRLRGKDASWSRLAKASLACLQVTRQSACQK